MSGRQALAQSRIRSLEPRMTAKGSLKSDEYSSDFPPGPIGLIVQAEEDVASVVAIFRRGNRRAAKPAPRPGGWDWHDRWWKKRMIRPKRDYQLREPGHFYPLRLGRDL